MKEANRNLASWAFVGISALQKEGRGLEKMCALLSLLLQAPNELLGFHFPPRGAASLPLLGASEGGKAQAQRLVLRSWQLDASVLLRFRFSKGKSKYLTTSEVFPNSTG